MERRGNEVVFADSPKSSQYLLFSLCNTFYTLSFLVQYFVVKILFIIHLHLKQLFCLKLKLLLFFSRSCHPCLSVFEFIGFHLLIYETVEEKSFKIHPYSQ